MRRFEPWTPLPSQRPPWGAAWLALLAAMLRLSLLRSERLLDHRALRAARAAAPLQPRCVGRPPLGLRRPRWRVSYSEGMHAIPPGSLNRENPGYSSHPPPCRGCPGPPLDGEASPRGTRCPWPGSSGAGALRQEAKECRPAKVPSVSLLPSRPPSPARAPLLPVLLLSLSLSLSLSAWLLLSPLPAAVVAAAAAVAVAPVPFSPCPVPLLLPLPLLPACCLGLACSAVL